jgi:regulator of sigma E protease
LGSYLIATHWFFDLQLWLVILQVAIGLGMVIFVHELGHFIVAKLCGVKCEKFYLGFDIFGWKICKFTRGETEYGIGILPLGGYVKMLGQEDNPARLAEEMERAKIAAKATAEEDKGKDDAAVASQAGSPPARPAVVFDPRSYLAKSVPKRMAIVSAGVAMNVVFAFVAAMIAYGMGVRDNPCVVSEVLPGEPAWEAGIRPGDQIVQLGHIKEPRYRDLQSGVTLGDRIDEGIPMLVERPGVEKLLSVRIVPNQTRLVPTIGIVSPRTTTLLKAHPVRYASPAADSRPTFQGGDKVVRVNGVPVESYAELQAQLALHPGEKLTFTVERAAEDSAGDDAVAAGATRQLAIDVAPNPMKQLGLVMKWGPLTAVQAGSPAAEAGLRAGDFLEKIDGQPPGDPMTLADRMRRKAGQTVAVTVARKAGGKWTTIETKARLRETTWVETPQVPGNSASVPALGIAYRVLNVVAAVEPHGPAARQGIRPGDEVVQVTLIPPPEPPLDEAGEPLRQKELKVELDESKTDWPFFFYALQDALPGTTVELVLKGDRKVTLSPVAAADWFNSERGLEMAPLYVIRKAHSLGEAASLGARETVDSVMQVYRFLQKIGTQISPKAIGGPVGIAQAAGRYAYEGPAQLLIFLTMLSANLAVLNFLPIPLLDGGLMVFLILEGILRKPVSEKIMVAFQYVGLFFILGLMLWVFGLDLGFIPRH